jgi:hypothetical protein
VRSHLCLLDVPKRNDAARDKKADIFRNEIALAVLPGWEKQENREKFASETLHIRGGDGQCDCASCLGTDEKPDGCRDREEELE